MCKTGLTQLEEKMLYVEGHLSLACFPLWDGTLPSTCLISAKCFLSIKETSPRENSSLGARVVWILSVENNWIWASGSALLAQVEHSMHPFWQGTPLQFVSSDSKEIVFNHCCDPFISVLHLGLFFFPRISLCFGILQLSTLVFAFSVI